MGNRPIVILDEMGVLGWSTLQIGYDRGWVSRPEIVNFATREIERNADATDTVCVIAMSEDLDDREFGAYLADTCANFDAALEFKKWKYAILAGIQSDPNLSDQEKYDLIQPLYAMFDYPKDLRPMWIYRETDNDAIEALNDLVARLRDELTGSAAGRSA